MSTCCMPSTRNVWETLPTTLNQDLRNEFQFLFILMFTEAEVNKRVRSCARVDVDFSFIMKYSKYTKMRK